MDPLRVPAPQETKLHFLDYWRIIRIRKTVILAVFLLVVITATLVTFILPESYASLARIKVERDQTDIPFTTDPRMGVASYDPYFIQNEFETIKSERVLSNVVASLNLNEDWGKKYNGGLTLKPYESIFRLKSMMDLQPERNTSFIDIKVLSEKPEEAAALANAIAKAYQSYRWEVRKNLSLGGIKALEERLAEHDAKVHAARTNVDRLREQYNIADAMAVADSPTMLMSAEQYRQLERMRIELESQVMREETLLDSLKATPRDKLVYSLPTASPDAALTSLVEQKNLAEQALIIKQKDYGKEHPEVVKLRDQLDDLKTKVDNQVDGILMGLDSRVSAVRQQLNKLKNEVENAKTNDIATARQTQPYWEAKRKLDDLQRFGQILVMKIASENIEASLPKTTMVEIMDDALPGIRPVKPNKLLNIGFGIIIGLVVGVGLAFFIEYLDTSVKTIDDVERSLQSPVLGVIPQNVGLVLEEGADSPHAEAYRVLRTNILFSRKDEKLNTIAVVSAGAGEGKSTTVFNLASVFAQSKQRTLMVDSDLRRPTLHKMLGVSNNLGLTNYLMKQNSLEEVIQTTDLPTLDFLASGKLPSSSLGILSSSQMKELINELKRRYDIVFFDSPPIMGVSDASILASEVDMTLQVIQYRRYPQPMNIRAKQLIEKVGGNLVGIVLNNINMSQDESYYYYSGYYHDYYSRNDDEETAARAEGDKTGRDEPKA
jgi:polysaccharide biosynthesis transport protein